MPTMVRAQSDTPAEKLSNRLFRKHMLRPGSFTHPTAPGGKLDVDREFCEMIAANFRKGLRDNVPMPLSHKDTNAITSVGNVVDVEVTDEGLFGYHLVIDEEDAERLGGEGKKWRGSSVSILMDYTDRETGENHGPVLATNIVTNAPWIDKLQPWEEILLGDEAANYDVVILSEPKEASVAHQDQKGDYRRTVGATGRGAGRRTV